MNPFISNMADEFSRTWHEQGDNLKENLNKLLQVGDDCINLWITPVENNHKYNCLNFENKLLKYFQAIDENSLNLQKCIINVLRYLSYTRQQLEERIEFKNTHSRCQTQISELQQQILLVKDKLENEEKKCQMMLQKNRNAKKAQRHFPEIQEDYWYKEQEIQNLNREIGKVNLENRYLKQKLVDVVDEHNKETKKLQSHLKEYEETFEKMRLDVQLLHENENEENLNNDIKLLEKNFAQFVVNFKKSLMENQRLRLQADDCNMENDSKTETSDN